MRFKQFLKEDSDEARTFVELRPVTDKERELIKKAQEFARIIHDLLKLGNKIQLEDVEKFSQDLKHFPDFKCLKHVTELVNDVIDAHGKMMSRGAHISDNIDKIKSSYEDLKKHFMAGTHAQGTAHKETLDKILDKNNAHVDAPAQLANHLKNNFLNSFTIFGTTRFLELLRVEDYEQVHSLDTNGPLFTMYDFPVKMMKEHWDYIIYFLLNLKTTGGHVEFTAASEHRQFLRAKHSGDAAYEELLKVMDKYLHDNDKALIPRIVELIEKIPEVKAANDKRKHAIKSVWRGVADADGSDEEIIEADRATKYVATSESLYAAKNFALAKGHLEKDRRSKVGHLIKYEVTPDAILFDTKIIATVFNESEVLIDATKALVKEIREI